MPFGLKNAPSFFQRLMNSMLADMARFSAAYIDDIVILARPLRNILSTRKQYFQDSKKRGWYSSQRNVNWPNPLVSIWGIE